MVIVVFPCHRQRNRANNSWGTVSVSKYVVVDADGCELGDLEFESDETKKADLQWFARYKKCTRANVLLTDDRPVAVDEDPYWQWRCALVGDEQVEGRLLFNIGKLESVLL